MTVPANANLSNLKFSPDGSKLAFLNTRDDGIELWVANATTGETKKISGMARLNAAAGDPCDWLADNKTGTCIGFYTLCFCQERNILSEGLGLGLEPLREGDSKRMTALRIAVELPAAFPEKYRDAIELAIDHCAVKNQIVNPPRFELHLI